MPTTTSSNAAQPGFIVDRNAMDLNSGRQIDWTNVPSSYQNADGKKLLKAGTAVVERASGKVVPYAGSGSATTLTSVVVASNVATATKTAHGYSVGETVTISGANLSYVNGRVVIATVPTANTFTYAAVGADATATGTIVATRAAVGLLVSNALEGDTQAAMTGYGIYIGGVVYENLLPDASGTPKVLSTALKTDLQYAGNTTGWAFVAYADSRAT